MTSSFEHYSRLKQHRYSSFTSDLPRAAVAMLLTEEADPCVILTKRSQFLNTHRGQVAFPGGMRDDSDPTLLATAYREVYEEIGIPASDIKLQARLSDVLSKFGILVTPFVASVQPDVVLRLNTFELESAFRVPLSFFLDKPPTRLDNLGFGDLELKVPAWYFQNYHIWGMTAAVLMEFFHVAFEQMLGHINGDLQTEIERLIQ